VVLLKGQPSIVAMEGAPLLVTTSGSSDVATGGMGDQLAGVIGALLAAGLSARDAAGAGLFMSGRAADLARRGRSLGPRDVSANLHRALRRPGAERSPFDLPFVTFDQPARW
jgi:NAD(P)H-hydrate repair Nnr-like enzyme with NAD(P)H-hydrate dehydratase domain